MMYGFELHIPDEGVMTALDVMPGSAIADLMEHYHLVKLMAR